MTITINEQILPFMLVFSLLRQMKFLAFTSLLGDLAVAVGMATIIGLLWVVESSCVTT
jgi:hypothetical protein